MEKDMQTTARVTVTVEVMMTQPWGGECKLDQAFDQAARGAKVQINRLLKGDPVVRMVGEPHVQLITTEKK
jgi:hypothetical protein